MTRSEATRGRKQRLAPLRNSAGVRDFVLDQLAGVKDLYARSMFGGIGLYAGDLFFGILAGDRLYFKVDDRTRPAYEAAGMPPFKPYEGRPMTMMYYEVPLNVVEDGEALLRWAREAIAVAEASPPTKRRAAALTRAKSARRRR